MALVILPFSSVSSQAQMLVQEQHASQFAKTHKFEDSITKAIKKAEETFAEAKKENKSANMIQCGKSICDLDKNVCVKKFVFRGDTTWSCKDKNYELVTDVGNGEDYETESYCYKDCFKKEGVLTKGDYVTATDADGNKYRIYVGSETISIQYDTTGNNGKTFRGCEVLPVKMYNYKKCFFCPLLGVVYDGSAKLVDRSFPTLSGSFVALLVVGMGIWIAIQVLGQISSLTKQDAQKFLGSLIKQGYKFLIAVLLLIHSQQIFKYGVKPLIDSGLEFGEEMLHTDYNESNYQGSATQVTGGVYLDLITYEKIEQYVVAIQNEIAFMQAVGTSLWCIGGNSLIGRGINNLWKDIGDGFAMLIQGGIITVFAFLLSIAFIFYLIDAVVQLGIVAALSPFLIASWPFKATAKYTKTGINMFLNSVFIFIFVGLVISINFELLNQALNSSPGRGSLMAIAEAINAQDSLKLVEYTELTGISLLILIFCCIFGFKFTNQASALASKFAGGFMTAGKKAIAPGIATMGTSAAKSFALNATQDTREAIGRRFDKLGKELFKLPYTIPKAIINYARKQKQTQNGQTLSSAGRASVTNPPVQNPPHNPTRNGSVLQKKIEAAQKPKQRKTTFTTNNKVQTNKRTKKGGSSTNRKRKSRRR